MLVFRSVEIATQFVSRSPERGLKAESVSRWLTVSVFFL